jgi:anaerobic magnesium-protoporphyrin IX monomethyl ester cyclase
MDEPLLDAISQNGCRAIHFGVESGSQAVLDRIQKNINLASAYKKITYAASKSMLVCCYFMLGHYCDTQETMQKTCDLIMDLSENHSIDASVHYNTPYPGTYQFENRELLGLRLTSDKFSDFVGYRPIVETEEFSIADQIKCLKSISKYLNKHDFAV